MRRIEAGLTVPEVLVVAFIIAAMALVVFLALPRRRHEQTIKLDCNHNVRMIVGLIEANSATKYPPYGGADLILYLVAKQDLVTKKNLQILFCPGDKRESFQKAGGMNAYRGLVLKKRGEHGHLTSYAGRNQLSSECAAKKGAITPVILICDDSEDHHDHKGFVVGYSGGAVKWRDKVANWGLDYDTPVDVGENSSIDELKCLLAE